MVRQTFPTREALHRLPFTLPDVVVILGALALLALIARVGAGAFGRFAPPDVVPGIDLDPSHLPYYAGRSTLRMFIALGGSLLFTLAYGYVAAKSRRAERLLIPLLDILQLVPVLGFLSITVTGFIALFPGSLLGLEAASIFAIFTSQAWNMTFSFYQSLRTLPRELDEAAMLYRLSRWQRFIRLEVPAAMIGLVWNAMMSFGGGWFFVAASEAISVLNQKFTLPGIGSYVAIAVEAQDFRALVLAVVTMAVVIVAVDQCFWRPVVAWADKFRLEQSAAADAPRSWLLDLLRTARLPRVVGNAFAPVGEVVNRLLSRLTPLRPPRLANSRWQRWGDRLYTGMLLVLVAGLLIDGGRFILGEVGLSEVGTTIVLGLATFGRVLLVLVVGTLVWVPVGVAIGFHPRLARLLQPVVQFLASFPANFLFPFATLFFIRAGISLNWGGILLMALGAQWYILFNTIAGAMSIPTDLREMAANMGVCGWRLWRTLIIPGILIDLARPHDRANTRFKTLVDYIYTVMTHPEADVVAAPAESSGSGTARQPSRSPYAQPLPHARAGGISGLLELIVEQPGGRHDIPRLAERLQLQVDDLLPILDAAVLLGFAAITQGAVTVTPSGRAFADADILTSKDLFRQAVLAHASLVASMYQTLREKRDGTMGVDFFLDLLDEHYPSAEAERQLTTAVDWGRYAELFEYDASQRRLYLPEPVAGVGDESA